MGYCVMFGGNVLWVIVWGMVEICYGLFCSEWWDFVVMFCVVIVIKCYFLLCGEWWNFVIGFVVSGGNLLWVVMD
jgi:hypothetical protein